MQVQQEGPSCCVPQAYDWTSSEEDDRRCRARSRGCCSRASLSPSLSVIPDDACAQLSDDGEDDDEASGDDMGKDKMIKEKKPKAKAAPKKAPAKKAPAKKAVKASP